MAPTLVSGVRAFAFSSLILLSSVTHSNAAGLEKRVAPPATLPGTWTYKGCYTDAQGSRTLNGPGFQDGTAMTDAKCINFCDSKGYVYAGTEYGGECYCGNAISAPGVVANAADCNMACTGAPAEACGAGNRLTLFYSGAPPPPAPTTNPGPTGWTSKGCYAEGTTGRALPNGVATTGGGAALTVAKCTTACKNAGYSLAGVEYGGECYCGNAIVNGGAPAASGCNMVCNGNSAEFCGGGNRLNVYQADGTTASPTSSAPTSTPTGSAPAGFTNLGCYTDAVGARTLSTPVFPAGALTIESCTSACKAAGFTIAGAEYGGECYCDDSFKNGGGPAPDGNAGCNMACNGNAAETCGGPNRLNVYKVTGTGTPSSSSTTATGTGSATGLPSGWSYKGCYVDGVNGRDLINQLADSATNTIESCVSRCVALGYTVAGAEFGRQCFCDNFLRNGAALASSDSQCNQPCAGNSAEKCGGPNLLSLYAKGTLQTYQVPAPQTTDLPGNWVYQGCLKDDAEARTFPYQIILSNNNTATNCLSLCSKFGYGSGGMEFGDECYCGDKRNILDAGATIQPAADCNVACTGDPGAICGGGNRISYYSWAGNLQKWSYPTGAAAGQYRFLIGGVTIPLITTPAINGKVTYIEKYGTSPANNGTGAYELDLAQINNFQKAWRPMHVKTDVFCAAGLTLPDKVGRQINIGGWANDATYGVRLYWPDGSPGVDGVNDWQESVNEVSLQAGRWYPTGMIMANGSILVVGGEEGSNGAPVPSLEVLPKPAGGFVLFCDWLQRTDPYNLYPYLAVLPSGGIFVGYYNEARILSETTFATIKTLPNIPGAVNNFLGGRTYPFEGTAVLLPQRAPYTEPLTVMVCGGSTPGPEIALDNCVSLQPDVADAEWTIERMPSKRVITCMTALPDGTFIILNGGQQGRAGFGLAIEPNLNAVLYDPSKPVNQRMSVMANTTVDRLYHSEAVLLQDGRVLVSGSDPEDVRFPQEYRNEVFLPPYLTSGAARPAFTITNKDWSYGQAVTIGITAGSTANLKVSLLGAESSTHGNSMGQRTIFPAVSCAATTCTITAPPNAHICPPGWFQLFVLDGPTPSNSQWVRIGGDPAQLGNWPDFPAFDVPGV